MNVKQSSIHSSIFLTAYPIEGHRGQKLVSAVTVQEVDTAWIGCQSVTGHYIYIQLVINYIRVVVHDLLLKIIILIYIILGLCAAPSVHLLSETRCFRFLVSPAFRLIGEGG